MAKQHATKFYYAPRYTKFNPGAPTNQLVLYEQHPRHPLQKNGMRYIYIAEGDLVEAFPTAKVRRLAADGKLEERKSLTDYPKDKENPDALLSLDLTQTVLDRLEAAGYDSVSDLVNELAAGESLTDHDGITAATERAVIKALVDKGFLDDDMIKSK